MPTTHSAFFEIAGLRHLSVAVAADRLNHSPEPVQPSLKTLIENLGAKNLEHIVPEAFRRHRIHGRRFSAGIV